MKKQLLTAAVAIVALAGCTKTEVVKVSDDKAIGFESFVGKPTKAVSDIVSGDGSFTKFFVYGSYENEGSYVSVYGGEYVQFADGKWNNEKLQYWVDGKNYKFAAYSNGNEKVDGVKFTDAEGNLEIPYTVADKDLIAVTGVAAAGQKTGNQPVGLEFKHLLSKVKFSFSTTFNADLTVTVSNLKINQAVNAGTWKGTWTPTEATKADKEYGDVVAKAKAEVSEECYVLPQSNATLTASFTVTVTDKGGAVIMKKDFADVKLVSGNGDKWDAGFAYNYTATIKPENMGGGVVTSEPIVFNPSVDPWKNGTVTDNDILN